MIESELQETVLTGESTTGGDDFLDQFKTVPKLFPRAMKGGLAVLDQELVTRSNFALRILLACRQGTSHATKSVAEYPLFRANSPGCFPTLASNEVHVWSIPLDFDLRMIDQLESVLAPEERAHALRFHFAKDRNQFILARGTLRNLLGCYLHRAPQDIGFSCGRAGKPTLACDGGSNDLQFSLSHTDGLAMIAFARRQRVGVDVERLRTDLPCMPIAREFFSLREYQALALLPVEVQVNAFLHCWTRKEALLKATGDGLRVSLNSFDVPIAPGESHCVVPCGEAMWSLYSLDQTSEWVTALAVEGCDWQGQLWQVTEAVVDQLTTMMYV